MIYSLSLLLLLPKVLNGAHFNGGTIRWKPVDPYDTSNSTTIIITQTYYWTYPVIKCDSNVPASTSGRGASASDVLICTVDCTTSGGYSTKPISALTDCISTSSSLNMMTSQRSVNITLTIDAHFYIAYVGTAWRTLDSPVTSSREWSIVTYIDLRKRPDGSFNTPPEATIISPQYAIVNRKTQMRIAVSDANVGDDVRCRWSVYRSGYRRRRDEYKNFFESEKRGHLRKRDGCGPRCRIQCREQCDCACAICTTAKCGNDPNKDECEQYICPQLFTTTETPGTPQSTSSYPIRQAIDECGGICHTKSVPNSTTLSNCTISFTGLMAGVWYGIAVQVEDFINSTSTIPMSSVPVQFLIYVVPKPECSTVPVILPHEDCLEVTAGVSTSFTLSVLSRCNSSSITISDLVISSDSAGIQSNYLTQSMTNSSLFYKTFTFTPPMNQTGFQQICTTAFTTEFAESDEYCVLFTVKTSTDLCPTTTTSTTATTSTSTSATSTTGTTSSSVSTTATFTSTSTTTTAAAMKLQTLSATSGKGPSWGLLAGIFTAALPLGLCCCCCLYRRLWSSSARRRRHEEEEEAVLRYRSLAENTESSVSGTSRTQKNPNAVIEVPPKSFKVYDIVSRENSMSTTSTNLEGGESILVAMYNSTNGRRANSVQPNNTNESFDMQHAFMGSRRNPNLACVEEVAQSAEYTDSSRTQMGNSRGRDERFDGNY